MGRTNKMVVEWEKLRTDQFDEAIAWSGGVCVVPVGCLEMHGQHLPVGTDIMKISYIARRAAEIEPVVIFPDFFMGDMQGHYKFRGGLVLSPELMLDLLWELCSEIGRNGFSKVVLANSHGGNTAMLNHFLRSLASKKRDFVVTYVYNDLITPYELIGMIDEDRAGLTPELNDEDIEVIRTFVRDKHTCGHACFGETSFMQGSYPETVRLDRMGAVSGLSTHRADYLSEAGIIMRDAGWGVNFPNSYAGHDPVGCGERIGRCTVRLSSERLARQFRLLKGDENLLKWNEEYNKSW